MKGTKTNHSQRRIPSASLDSSVDGDTCIEKSRVTEHNHVNMPQKQSGRKIISKPVLPKISCGEKSFTKNNNITKFSEKEVDISSDCQTKVSNNDNYNELEINDIKCATPKLPSYPSIVKSEKIPYKAITRSSTDKCETWLDNNRSNIVGMIEEKQKQKNEIPMVGDSMDTVFLLKELNKKLNRKTIDTKSTNEHNSDNAIVNCQQNINDNEEKIKKIAEVTALEKTLNINSGLRKIPDLEREIDDYTYDRGHSHKSDILKIRQTNKFRKYDRSTSSVHSRRNQFIYTDYNNRKSSKHNSRRIERESISINRDLIEEYTRKKNSNAQRYDAKRSKHIHNPKSTHTSRYDNDKRLPKGGATSDEYSYVNKYDSNFSSEYENTSDEFSNYVSDETADVKLLTKSRMINGYYDSYDSKPTYSKEPIGNKHSERKQKINTKTRDNVESKYNDSREHLRYENKHDNINERKHYNNKKCGIKAYKQPYDSSEVDKLSDSDAYTYTNENEYDSCETYTRTYGNRNRTQKTITNNHRKQEDKFDRISEGDDSENLSSYISRYQKKLNISPESVISSNISINSVDKRYPVIEEDYITRTLDDVRRGKIENHIQIEDKRPICNYTIEDNTMKRMREEKGKIIRKYNVDDDDMEIITRVNRFSKYTYL